MKFSLVGIYFLFLGSIFCYLSYQLDFGNLHRVGTGALPFLLSIFLIMIGIYACLFHNSFLIDFNYHSFLVVLISIICFCIFTYWINIYLGILVTGIIYFYGSR